MGAQVLFVGIIVHNLLIYPQNNTIMTTEEIEKAAEEYAKSDLGAVMGSILSVANGWGEASTFYKVGSYYEKVEIAKIQQETKVLGAGYYNDLTINCYVGYSGDGKKLFEINDGANVEVRYCP